MSQLLNTIINQCQVIYDIKDAPDVTDVLGVLTVCKECLEDRKEVVVMGWSPDYGYRCTKCDSDKIEIVTKED